MNFNFNIYAIILLVLSAVLGFGGGFIADRITKDEQKQTNLKIALKSAAMLGIIGALLLSIYL